MVSQVGANEMWVVETLSQEGKFVFDNQEIQIQEIFRSFDVSYEAT